MPRPVNIAGLFALTRQRKGLFDLVVVLGVTLLGLSLILRIFQSGFPPGVDTPLFLHLSWFTQEMLQGSSVGLLDPYWYGGFHPFTTYPPLTYSLVGGLATLPGMSLVPVYKGVLLAAYVGTSLATYVLVRELGTGRLWSGFAAVLTTLAHPMLVSIGLWGWLSSIAAMPFALLAFTGLERAYHRGQIRYAAWGGVALGLAILTHHMTAFAFGLGLPAWALFYLIRYPSARRHLYRVALWFMSATVIVSIWWIIPWLVNLLDAGFRREVPGLWTFQLRQYVDAITNTNLIAQYAFPSYLGIGLIVLAVGGTVQALVTPSRATPYAILLLILVALSLGEQVNPLLRLRPFDSLDVARFHLFMVPIMAFVGLPFLESVGGGLGDLLRLRRIPRWLPASLSGALAFVVLGQMSIDAVSASQVLFQPYRVTTLMEETLDWFKREGGDGKVLGVGLWHWDDFLLPYYLQRGMVDGWHDEGAKNWRTVRPLRLMMWNATDIDIDKAYELLGELEGQYIAVDTCYPGEAPSQFRAALRERPELFQEVIEFHAPLEECQELFPRVSRSYERFRNRLDGTYPLEEKRYMTIFQRVAPEATNS